MSRSDFLCLIGITCVLTVLQIEAKLAKTPSDAVASLGDSVVFQCFTENKTYPPTWHHTKVESSEVEVYTIFVNGKSIYGRMVSGYNNRMEVLENRTTGEYSLKIRSVLADDAGQYRCTARGGIGQPASAELVVIESPVKCDANTYVALGERICGQGPDYVNMSCSFQVTGSHLPSVSLVRTNDLENVLQNETARWTNEPGIAASEFILRADTLSSNSSSFTCILNSPDAVIDDRLHCTMSKINVIKISEYIQSKSLSSPEEVLCPLIPLVTQTGYKWVNRKLDQPKSPVDNEVSKTRTLNLFRPEMNSGLYVCIIDWNIENKHCPVEALTVTYQKPDEPSSTTATTNLVAFGIVSFAIIVGLTSFFSLRNMIKKRLKKQRDKGNQSGNANGYSNGTLQHNESLPRTINSDSSDQPILSKDEGDSDMNKVGGNALRLRRIEETARARMKQNAALRQRNLSQDVGDVAEGLHFATDKKSQ